MPTGGQDPSLDSAGTPIILGDTVKLVGVITGVNLFDNRFRDIEVTLSHPVAMTPQASPTEGGNATNLGPGLKINVPASVLTKGS